MKAKTVLLLALFIAPFSVFAGTIETTIYVNATVTVSTFKPMNIFGNNTNGWSNPVKAKDKIAGAGNFLLRYPDGSWGDIFCWNSSGKYDKKGKT